MPDGAFAPSEMFQDPDAAAWVPSCTGKKTLGPGLQTPARAIAALRAAGHRIVYVEELDAGIDDDQVLDLANRSGALLLTSDKDFGELVFRQGLVHAGVIL